MKIVMLTRIEWIYLAAIVVVTGLALFLVHMNLDNGARDTINQFTQSNRAEIAAKDTMQLASKLNALLASDNIQCIRGHLGGNEFINFARGRCSGNLLLSEAIFKSQAADDFEIRISYRLSDELAYSILFFLLLEVSMFVFLMHANRQKIVLDEKAKELVMSISRQVAHDIRSPLSALNLAVSGTSNFSQENINLIKNATQRINEIANDLLKKGTQPENSFLGIKDAKDKATTAKVTSDSSTILLPPILENIVKEKQAQYSNQPEIEIFLDSQLNDVFVAAEAPGLARIISNLINNSVEALVDGKGVIKVSARSYRDRALITIQDNGHGMTEEVLQKLGEKNFSRGKENLSQSGSGLGVSNAMILIQSWQGSLQFKSKEGIGTTADIILKRIINPS